MSGFIDKVKYIGLVFQEWLRDKGHGEKTYLISNYDFRGDGEGIKVGHKLKAESGNEGIGAGSDGILQGGGGLCRWIDNLDGNGFMFISEGLYWKLIRNGKLRLLPPKN